MTTVRAYLDYHRDTLRWKVDGLTREQLAQTLPPSTMTLGGMLKHLALVEWSWFERVLHGRPPVSPFVDVDWDADPDWDWHSAVDDSPEQLRQWFDEAVARADAAIDEALAAGKGLDVESALPSRREEGHFTLRWILLHMIEEYARHNGHADLLREAIDGRTGE
ncbi:DinB family protein [Nocardioides sp. TF02-7]|uniref:DinB family protein n=1 Tax=Nocardioides sp. TF02-7 TaxID=2917724 RepID=UPI001F051BB2|nr:DinB family protein [Nocardioides sp. TF02-7]UMG91482.1 DinB family protein [Nocardioides sp. TF02-7]